jgi:hypothetical protein
MKKTFSLFVVVLAFGFRNSGGENLTPAERKFAIDYLKKR